MFSALQAGVVTGLAITAKLSLLLVALPCLLILAAVRCRNIRTEWGQWLCVLAAKLWVVNSLYAFTGTFEALGSYEFCSAALSGLTASSSGEEYNSQTGNRFREAAISKLPIPFPHAVLQGIDVQMRDFERQHWCYLGGQWQQGGWWSWYLYATFIKTPAGTFLLLPLVVVGSLRKSSIFGAAMSQSSKLPAGQEWLFLLLVPGLLMLIVSSQTSMTKFYRYVLPCFPFTMVILSGAVSFKSSRLPYLSGFAWLCVTSTVISTLSSMPSTGSFSTSLIGPASEARKHLAYSAIDWGQDFHLLCRWIGEHPERRPLVMATVNTADVILVDQSQANLEYDIHCLPDMVDPVSDVRTTPYASWYAVGIGRLTNHKGDWTFLRDRSPVDNIGNSILIYHLSASDVASWNENHE